MNQLLGPAIGVVGDVFESYDPIPFGLQPSDFTDYAIGQLQKRMDRLERARGASLEEINRVTTAVIESGDA